MTAAKPEEGVPAAPPEEVEARMTAISGRGIETGRDGEAIVIAWAARVASAGAGGAEYECLYRAIRVELDPESKSASGICLKTSADAELDLGGAFSGSLNWERGQHIGSETMHVLAWLGCTTPRAGPTSPVTSPAGRTCATR